MTEKVGSNPGEIKFCVSKPTEFEVMEFYCNFFLNKHNSKHLSNNPICNSTIAKIRIKERLGSTKAMFFRVF